MVDKYVAMDLGSEVGQTKVCVRWNKTDGLVLR